MLHPVNRAKLRARKSRCETLVSPHDAPRRVRAPEPVNLLRSVRRFWNHSRLESLTTKRLLFLPVLGELRAYNRQKFNRDARAGLFTATLALPQGLALALIAGLPPTHGIYAGIVGMAVGAVFSGLRAVSIGPSLTTAVLLLSLFVRYEITPEQRAQAVGYFLVLTALILGVVAWFRIAQLTRFVSRSVVIGFITTASVLVFASQFKYVFGLDLPETGVFLEDVRLLVRALPNAQWPALLVGSITAGIYLALSVRARGMPAGLLAVLGGSVAGALLVHGGFDVARLDALRDPLLLPAPGDLHFEWSGVIAQAALATALFTQLEVSTIARSYASRSGELFDPNQQMYGLALAQLGNAFFSGLPASASLERTRLLWRQRPATALAGVFSSLFCAALFLAVAGWIEWVPRAALAALLMVLATEVVSRHYLRVILRSSPDDALVLVATIAAGLVFRLDVALYLGAGISILLFLRKVGVPEMTEFGFTGQGQLAAVAPAGAERTPEISIVHVEGDLFFGAAEIFHQQALRVCEDPNLKVIVLRMKNAHHLDATCALAIEELLRFAREHDRHIIVSGAHREIYRVFRRSGLLDRLGRDNFFMHVPSNPTVSTRNALKRAQFLLGGREANITIVVDATRNPPPPAEPARAPTAADGGGGKGPA